MYEIDTWTHDNTYQEISCKHINSVNTYKIGYKNCIALVSSSAKHENAYIVYKLNFNI